MAGFNKKTIKRIEWTKKKIARGEHKATISSAFCLKFGVKEGTFTDTWAYIKWGKVRNNTKNKSIITKVMNTSTECYFCKNPETQKHHISYRPQKIVYLCGKCHGKLHSIILEYHLNSKEKDSHIKQLEKVIENIGNLLEIKNG